MDSAKYFDGLIDAYYMGKDFVELSVLNENMENVYRDLVHLKEEKLYYI